MDLVRYVIEKKALTVFDNTVAAERLGDFFKSPCKSSVKVGKKLAENTLKNSGRAPEIGANFGTALAPGSPKETLSTSTAVINFYHTGKGLYCFKFV